MEYELRDTQLLKAIVLLYKFYLLDKNGTHLWLGTVMAYTERCEWQRFIGVAASAAAPKFDSRRRPFVLSILHFAADMPHSRYDVFKYTLGVTLGLVALPLISFRFIPRVLSASKLTLRRLLAPQPPTLEFEYASSLDSQSIRLVRILKPRGWPISWLSMPKLAIETFPVDADLPGYVALSYTWGPPREDSVGYEESNKLSIILNGQHFQNTRNLYD